MPPRQLTGNLIVVAAGAINGCNYPTKLPIEYELEHLRIGVEADEGPLCQGDLLDIEHQLARIEDELEFVPKQTYSVYIWSDETWFSGAMNNCASGDHTVFGCTSWSRAIIWTTRWTLGHEIVHAAMGKSSLHPFFEEGLAEVYGGSQTRFLGWSAPSANKNTDRYSADIGTAAHFIRWLRERWGPHQLARLAKTGNDGFSEFESIYGMTIEEAEQLYFAEAPYAYASFSDCDDPELSLAEIIDGWIDTITFDCEAGADTRSAGIGSLVYRTLDIPESGYYSVSTNGEWFDIYRCGDRFEDAPASDEWWTEDVPPSYAGYPSPASRHYAGGEVHDLYFEAGRHNIGVGILGHEHGIANVAIWPSLAPTPGGSK